MKDLKRALGYLKPYQWTAIGAVISMLLVTGVNLINPQILSWVIDEGLGSSDGNIILLGTVLLIGIALGQGIFNFFQGFLSEKASQSVAYDLLNQLFTKIQSLSFSYHDQAQTGQLMTRATSDVEMVRQFTGMGLFQLINATLMLIGSAIILFAMNWQLALVTLATMPIMILILMRFIRSVIPLFGTIQIKLSKLNTVLQENLAGVRVVKAFASEPYEVERFTASNEDYKEDNIHASTVMATNFPLIFFVANLGTAAIIWIGGNQVIGGALSIGQLVAFNTYLAFLIMPVLMIGMIASMLARAGISAKRIFEVLDAPNDIIEKSEAIPLPIVVGQVEFKHVNFQYNEDSHEVLDDISFTAHAGDTIAVIGATGSGKTTLINLIPRFYDVTDGAVLVDGHDIRDVTLSSLRSQIGVVMQESVLFSGTIRENIAYGQPDVSEEEIIAVAKASQAHNFITTLPDAYETKVGGRGVGLSGGQKQRIAIARALLMNPKILIMDDSTSAVDAETEYQIQQALDTLMEDPTSFVIAHRISTIQKADKILVMNHGTIVAVGTHKDLLEQSGLYREIFDAQFATNKSKPQPQAV